MYKIKNVIEGIWEVVLIGFWILMIFSNHTLPIKINIFFIIIGCFIILLKYLSKINKYASYLLIFSFFLLFQHTFKYKLALFTYLIPWNIVLLTCGVTIVLILNWNKNRYFIQQEKTIGFFLCVLAGLISIKLILFIILKMTYDLEFDNLQNILRTLITYCLLAFLLFDIALNDSRQIRIAVSVIVCNLLYFVLH